MPPAESRCGSSKPAARSVQDRCPTLPAAGNTSPSPAVTRCSCSGSISSAARRATQRIAFGIADGVTLTAMLWLVAIHLGTAFPRPTHSNVIQSVYAPSLHLVRDGAAWHEAWYRFLTWLR